MERKKCGKVKLNNKGFSLVELIIVIAIMAVLAASIAPTLIRYINKARYRQYINLAKNVELASNAVYAQAAADGYNIELMQLNAMKADGTPDATIKVYIGTGNRVNDLKTVDSDAYVKYCNLFFEIFTDGSNNLHATTRTGKSLQIAFDREGNIIDKSPVTNQQTYCTLSKKKGSSNFVTVKRNVTDGTWYVDGVDGQ